MTSNDDRNYYYLENVNGAIIHDFIVAETKSYEAGRIRGAYLRFLAVSRVYVGRPCKVSQRN